jgi:hypothetical protein
MIFIIMLLSMSVIFAIGAIVTAALLREFNLRTTIASYPAEIYNSPDDTLGVIEKTFGRLYEDDIITRKKIVKSYYKGFALKKILQFLFRKARPLGYEFTSSHYPACLGNLSEVAPCVRIVVTCKKKDVPVSNIAGAIKIRGLTGDKDVICRGI